jgi:hypothetical protein
MIIYKQIEWGRRIPGMTFSVPIGSETYQIRTALIGVAAAK